MQIRKYGEDNKRTPHFEKKDYYFGSLAAIYSVLTPEQVGVKYNTLRNAKWREISVYQTNRAIIKQGELIRSGRK